MKFRKNFGEFIAENTKNESSGMFLSEKTDHEGWLVVGFDKDTKKAEVLSIPLLRKEAVRFLQSFESQMGKLADHMKKYTKLKLAHASEVFESMEFDGDTYVFEEMYDLVRDLKSALGTGNSQSAVEDYLGYTLDYQTVKALKRARVIR
jgi:hypothetical protein